MSLLKADQDGGQGDGHWAEYLRLAFHRTTQPPGYTFEDFGKITAPALILVGDRDDYCTLDDGVTAYRQLANGEIAVLPGAGHIITAAKIELALNFVDRHLRTSAPRPSSALTFIAGPAGLGRTGWLPSSQGSQASRS